jgi:hypothetical protein
MTLNQRVVGSSPSGGILNTLPNKNLWQDVSAILSLPHLNSRGQGGGATPATLSSYIDRDCPRLQSSPPFWPALMLHLSRLS